LAPDQPLVITPDRSVTYGECLQLSERFARGLMGRSIDRFACVLSNPADVIAVLCASSAIGSEACVFPADIDAKTADDYLDSFEQPVVISDRALSLKLVDVLPPRRLLADEPARPEFDGPFPVLILTTGTTGRPRGVRHDWSRLVGAARRAAPEPGARWLLAYNLHQFAGVQMLLHVLASRGTLVAPRSNHARDAVDAVRENGVTHVSATPTFWRMFIAQLDPANAADLPLVQITLGGEAVPGPLIASLARLFPQAKISQVYASSEFGSVGSVRDGRSGLPLSLLERGEDADIQVRIVDGELQIRSRVGMLGYYGEPDAGDGWRATGDLVDVEEDRIVFVGRAGDTINVGGVKVHPLPVEEAAAKVDGVELAHAYGRPSPVTGQIVALDVVARPDADRKRIQHDINEACRSLVPAARPRRIRFVDDIDVKGQKIRRQPQR
jgi:acyl-coenzyme A synthetase/AMP-(fatty) acid ligase